ncbi:DUF2637 domain-containing protein [Streptomyces sp. NPDC101115]|uniref:DUF2637 domain-containing protein n=1 Tax=Streptomyces sp. NPDC101115 TaxID=3366106 RepID=UPI003818EBF8
MHHPSPTAPQRRLIAAITGGAAVIALIGFVGSYSAVSKRARAEGLGWFADVFPLGVDAGIVVLLALDLLLAWLRMPLPLLRHTAWLLTAATIAFNAATAWPDPLGVSMHAVIPLLFVVTVEAARHAVGRLADITADRHIEPVRLIRWLLSPARTFVMWRRMKLWEMRSYADVVRFEQERLVYRAQLQARYGRAWRRKAPVEALLPLRLMRYGRPLAANSAEVGVEAVAPAPDSFEIATAEAVALAPAAPAPRKFVLDLAPMHPPIPELTAPDSVLALAARRTRIEVHARIPYGHPNLNPNAEDGPECVEPENGPDGPEDGPDGPEDGPDGDGPQGGPDGPEFADPEFADLVRRGRELAKTGRLTLKRAKAELHIGQPKAQAVIAVVHPKPKGP